MKHLALFSSLLGAFCLSAPVTGWSRDHHDHHGNNHCDSHHSHHSNSSYCRPSISYRSYSPYSYSNYGYGYGSNYGYPYGYSPYSYYSRPSIGFTYASGPSYSYYRGSRAADYDDDLAVDVQRALARRGYYRGAIDGDVGPGTRGAIREYQYRNRLEVTGRIDRSLVRALGLS